MKEKLFKDIFASSAQIITNQAASLIIFLVTSTYLVKDVYGEFNWLIAIFTMAMALLSFGMEPIIVKKIAAGEDIKETAGLFILHTLISSLSLTVITLLLSIFAPSFFRFNSSFILFAISFLLTYLSSPFKQVANGKQWFHYLAVMSIISNIVKALSLLLLVIMKIFSFHSVLLVFVISSGIELIVSAGFTVKKTGLALFTLSWNRNKYFSLVKESLPQVGVTIFSSSLARFDWIFLGIVTTKTIIADYSFTYKVYELCTMPLYIIGPLLLPRFARLFSPNSQSNPEEKKDYVYALVRLEIILASFIGLIVNLAWIPVVDGITGNKYGAPNVNTIFILSCSMPFLYVTNLLWTINFSQGYLKKILGIISITFFINILGDVVLIPLWQGMGAAIAFLAAIVIQAIIYMRRSYFPGLNKIWLPLIICPVSAIVSGELAIAISNEYWLSIPFALILFSGSLIISRQIIIKDWRLLKTALGL
jgi:O-antigen/teichoic acid export membrane protein